jgi:hypothetical protein
MLCFTEIPHSLLQQFEAEAHVNNVQEFSPYRKENHITITEIMLLTLFKGEPGGSVSI